MIHVLDFEDFFYQDAIDLILGNYTVEENEGISRPSPLQAERDWKFYAVSPEHIKSAKFSMKCTLIKKIVQDIFVNFKKIQQIQVLWH